MSEDCCILKVHIATAVVRMPMGVDDEFDIIEFHFFSYFLEDSFVHTSARVYQGCFIIDYEIGVGIVGVAYDGEYLCHYISPGCSVQLLA